MTKTKTVSKELLLRLYIDERQPTETIGASLGVSGSHIRRLLKKFAIPTIDRREEHAAWLRKVSAEFRFKKGSTVGINTRFKPNIPSWCKGLTKLTHPSIAASASAKTGQPRPDMIGEKHPLWNGGSTTPNMFIRRSDAYKRWRDDVFKRDGFTCKDCGVVGGRLHAHHILSFSARPDLRLDISNGVTLCISCHSKRHPDKPDLKNKAKSLAHRLSLSEAQRLVWADPEKRKRQSILTKLGMTEAVKQKISDSKKGAIPWNKGLTKKDSPGLASTGSKNRERMKGKTGKSSNVWRRWHPDD